ncbi:TPA: hypothetical protein N0F65_005864 [Lagenidium giganteum]|uniref:Uncharacterized protein n=1 Tax=Lagenidium giganteum TaxID=4803 RepID=A0AAV2YQF2_9STRA|nr:TPA: hypothetical protein N0F65_005864 [Lagenidium giganteum]
MDSKRLERAKELLDRVYGKYSGSGWKPKAFAGRSRRYLWSDAFGVCNYISLYYAHNEDTTYLDQADALIQDVHKELGRVPSTSTTPTAGGLCIGKEDEQDDGQYFHYLTKWMFALNRMSIARRDPLYNDWAIALGKVAHRHFVVRGLGGRPLRMVWKLSVDLQHVLVSHEGNLDAFDGYVMYRLMQQQSDDRQALAKEVADMQQLLERKLPVFATDDVLDAGEALWLTRWFPRENWAVAVAHIAMNTIDRLFLAGVLDGDPRFRLLFREMGTVLGIEVAVTPCHVDYKPWHQRIERVLQFWNERVFAHDTDISPLMFAAALVPGVWDPNRCHQTVP